jgi:HSP20 family protein
MLALTPWTKRTASLLPRTETPFGLMAEFAPLFERFFEGLPLVEAPEWRYPLTLEEKEKEVLVRAELPGFTPDEVKVEILGEMLVIEAEHKEEKKAGEEKAEKAYARVKREINIPVGVDLEKVEATYRHGVLEVHLLRKPEVAGRRIEVKT